MIFPDPERSTVPRRLPTRQERKQRWREPVQIKKPVGKCPECGAWIYEYNVPHICP